MLKKNIRFIQGFTLTELLVAVAINSILFLALMSLFISNLNYYRSTTAADKLSQQLQVAMDIMVADIRRAGFFMNAQNDIGLHQNNNPFQDSSNDINVNASGNCILFAYDKNQNGAIPASDATIDDERYGFRLLNGTLQARPPGANFNCNAAANNWENINNINEIRINALSFVLNTKILTTGAGTRGLATRSVDITLTGQLANDSSVTRTITQHVRLRNDKYIP